MKQRSNKLFKTYSIILIIVFAISLSYCYFFINYNKSSEHGNYLTTLDNIKKFQGNYNTIKNPSGNSQKEDTPLFTDGYTALLDAYSNFLELENCEVIITGLIKASAKVVKYNIELQCEIRKVDGDVESIVKLYCAESKDRCSASKCVYKGDTILEYKCNSTYKQNGNIIANFDGISPIKHNVQTYKSQRGTLPGELYYTINDKTVTGTSNFYIKRDLTGKISGYNTDFSLSPTTSTTKYAKMLQGILDGSKNYVFSNCKGSLSLDENGVLKSLQTSENFTLDFNLFGDAYWPVSCTNVMNFKINY